MGVCPCVTFRLQTQGSSFVGGPKGPPVKRRNRPPAGSKWAQSTGIWFATSLRNHILPPLVPALLLVKSPFEYSKFEPGQAKEMPYKSIQLVFMCFPRLPQILQKLPDFNFGNSIRGDPFPLYNVWQHVKHVRKPGNCKRQHDMCDYLPWMHHAARKAPFFAVNYLDCFTVLPLSGKGWVANSNISRSFPYKRLSLPGWQHLARIEPRFCPEPSASQSMNLRSKLARCLKWCSAAQARR